MKKHIEIFNRFGRRFAIVADCGNGNIEIDFYEFSKGRYEIEVSKVVIQYFSEVDFVNVCEATSVDIYDIYEIFDVMHPISLNGNSQISKNLRDIYSYSMQIRKHLYGEINLSSSREIFLQSQIRKLFKAVSQFIHA